MNVQLLDNLDKTTSARASPEFARDLVAIIPHLRAFSRMLCGKRGVADDMTQDALTKAWRSRASFEPGTNLKAWLFTILRNEFYSYVRKNRRQVEWDEGKGALIAGPANAQQSAMELSDTARAMNALPHDQREALILVGAGGFTYIEAAEICGTRPGTMKSRVARARAALHTALDGSVALPVRVVTNLKTAYSDILVQLSAVVPAGSVGASLHA